MRPAFAAWRERARYLIVQEALALENEAKLLALKIDFQNEKAIAGRRSILKNLLSTLRTCQMKAKARFVLLIYRAVSILPHIRNLRQILFTPSA